MSNRSHIAVEKSDKGMAFITILLLLAVTSALSMAFLQKAGIGMSATAARSTALQAQYLAESAANHALWRLLNETDFPSSSTGYCMHSLAGGRYGYKVRRHTDTTFATIATVGAIGEHAVHQSYVLYIKGWYDPRWLYRQKITISADVTDEDLTDFPYMVKITDASNALFMNAQIDGDEILFTNATHTVKLDHEIEKYASFEGEEELVAWVKIPHLSSTQATEIYMYYGNSGVTTVPGDPADVWSNGYEAVYHLHDGYEDSVGGHHGTQVGSPSTATGRIADCRDFYPGNGADKIDVGNWSVSGNQLTIQAWIKSDDAFAQYIPHALSKAGGTSGEQDLVWMMGLYEYQNLVFLLKTGTVDGAGTTYLFGSNPNGYLSDSNAWYLVAMTYNGSVMRIIRDGLNAGSTSKSGNLRENSWDIEIGGNPASSDTGSVNWDGKLDEVRISSVARSIDWMEAEYRNQGSPATYQALADEESYGATGTTVLEADFLGNTDGFTYTDDPFRGTSKPIYASGSFLASGGYANGGLRVLLGGIDNNTINGMSGGWQKTFNLGSAGEVRVSFLYKLTLSSEYESDEYGQTLVSVDGTLYGEGSDDYVVQINGDGNGGSADVTGWHRFQVNLGALAAGDHALVIGCYNNKKTYNDETVQILIDDVLVTKQ